MIGAEDKRYCVEKKDGWLGLIGHATESISGGCLLMGAHEDDGVVVGVGQAPPLQLWQDTRHRRLLRKETEVDLVFFQQRVRIALQQGPFSEFAKDSGPLVQVGTSVNEHGVFWGRPNQVTAEGVDVQHRSGQMSTLDEVDRFHRAVFLNLSFKSDFRRKSDNGDQQSKPDEHCVWPDAIFLRLICLPE